MEVSAGGGFGVRLDLVAGQTDPRIREEGGGGRPDLMGSVAPGARDLGAKVGVSREKERPLKAVAPAADLKDLQFSRRKIPMGPMAGGAGREVLVWSPRPSWAMNPPRHFSRDLG